MTGIAQQIANYLNPQHNGHKLLRARTKAGLTQRELAQLMGLSDPMTIPNWEAGRKQMPLRTLQRAAKAMNITVEQLLEVEPVAVS